LRHADLADAGGGIWVAVAKQDRGAVGNAAIIDLGDETLVDTHYSPGAARELRWERNLAALRG
jgi:hypothetical protein